MHDFDNATQNIDDILLDVKSLLDEEEQEPVRQRDRTLKQKLQTDREATMVFDARFADIIRGAGESADKAARDYGAEAGEEEVPAAPSFVAYNNDFGGDRFRENFAPRQPQQKPKGRKTQADRAAATKSEQRQTEEGGEHPAGKKKGRGCGCLLWLLVVFALLAGLLVGGVYLFGRLHGSDDTMTRREGVSTVLIAGTDRDGLRTDTIMLVTIDEKEKVYNILSIPRDTLTYAPYSVPKINAAYGYYGGGEAGMQGLCDLVEDCVGFQPDKYLLLNFDAFAELVDIMGGLTFNVPVDMELGEITLKAGIQHLDGVEALTVVRYRSGYPMADLQRIEVQRQLLKDAADQWLSFRNLLKVPQILACINENMETDLHILNLLWLARDLKVCTAGVNESLPGTAQMIGDGSYYVLEPSAVADMVNNFFSPYEEDITPEDLYIKVG